MQFRLSLVQLPLCARGDWCEDDVFSHPMASKFTVMSSARLRRLLTNLAEHQVGIQWVGGEPTMHQSLYPMALFAHELGLKQCLFTNGSLLDERRLKTLFDANLAFIRFSLDAATSEVHTKHHGYLASRGYAERVKRNLARAAELRSSLGTQTQIGVSLVVDETNLADVIPTCEFLLDICDRHGAGAVDYLIVRPTYQFYTAKVNLSKQTIPHLFEKVGEHSPIRARWDPQEFALWLLQLRSTQATTTWAELSSAQCLAAGWFSEVSPQGAMYLCSDRYGNPEYSIGNAVDSSIDEIWNGRQRVNTLRFANATRCFDLKCPRNGRGFSFNKIFHAIERERAAGRIAAVRTWVEDLRRLLPRPEHSFFL
jgi:radical SAM protein with 4Fe4S-binding SPASM domain